MAKKLTVESVRANFPVGAKVKYFPIVRDKTEFSEHTVRSEPWALGHGDIVLKISDKAGGYSPEHLELI